MKSDSFILKGDICYSSSPQSLQTVPGGYLLCLEGRCSGVSEELPQGYDRLPLLDCTGKLVTPGLTDLHVHAPQYTFRGLGMDMELLDWLNTHTFPEEAKYRDLEYARAAYTRFVEDVRRGPNTRLCVFATLHTPATLLLMELLEEAGLSAMVGRVNMDRNSSPGLQEESAEAAVRDTRAWLAAAEGRFRRVTPILTPRFIPSCSDALMKELGRLQQETGLPVQSHLSENPSEVAWVRELCPSAAGYGDAYASLGLFGGEGCPTIMAHCVYCDDAEIALMRERQVYVAHCPASNTNLSSGVAPVRRYLEEGIPVGLGSDVAGGTHCSIFRAMADAIQVSKLRWRLLDPSLAPLTAAEAFWLGTAGGGSFFGKAGSFAPGYRCDVLVIDDSRYDPAGALPLQQRLERTIYLSEDRDILHKFVDGVQLF